MTVFARRLAALALYVFLFPCAALAVERIESFHSVVDVGSDGALIVTETITVLSEGEKIKRGIYRDFPTLYDAGWGLRLKVGFKVVKALRDGAPEHFAVKRLDNGLRVYLGRRSVFIEPGVHTYELTYMTDNQLGFFDGHDELAWNVTGNGWSFPIGKASALVRLPDGARVLDTDGFTGPQGAFGRDWRVECPVAGHPPGTALFATTAPLAPYEGLTVVVRFPKGAVAAPPSYFMRLLRDNRLLFLGLAGIMLVGLAYLAAWFKVGRDPAKGAVAPLFHPPEGLSPAACRYIMNMGFGDKAMACALVSMAVKGWLAITKAGKHYELERVGEVGDQQLSVGEAALAEGLFGNGSGKTLVLKRENHKRIRRGRTALSEALKRHYKAMYFSLNTAWMLPGILLSFASLAALALSSGRIKEAGFLMVWLSVWSLGTGFLVRNAIRTRKIGMFLFALPFVGGWCMGAFMLVREAGLVPGLGVVVLGAMAALFGYLLKAPTPYGRAVMDQLEGFGLFLSVSERDRLNLLNPPERTPELFEAYLPYAMALDVEQQWGEQFAGVLAAAGADPGRTGYHPGWYHGGSFSSTDLGGFTSGLGSDLGGAVASSSTAPGSSGGGSGGSGGGGGGGGGGGW